MSMTQRQHWMIGAFGLASTALNTMVLGIFGVPPAIGSASDGDVALWVTDHRGRILAATILATLAWTCSLAFIAGLRALLRTTYPGSRLLLDLGLSAAIALFAVVGVGEAIMGTAAFLAGTTGGIQPELARLALTTLFLAFAVSAGPTLVLAAAFGTVMLRTRALPSWCGWGLLAVGVIHVGALLSVARTGPFAADGLFAIAAPSAYEAWQALTALAIVVRKPSALERA